MRIVEWGCGDHGQAVIRQLLSRGLELVGAIDRRPSRVGRDAGEVAGLGRALGIPIRHPDDATQLLAECRPDVCIVCTSTALADVYDQLETSASCGIDCITLSEEAFFPWTTAPRLVAKLDEIAKAHDCTISASGATDTLMGWLATTLGASAHRIERLAVSIQYDVDDNSRLMTSHGVGLDEATFAREIGSAGASFYSRPIAEWLCSAFGWSVLELKQRYRPIFSDVDVYSSGLGGHIGSGRAFGMCDSVLIETREGHEIENSCIGKIYRQGDEDSFTCSVRGSPDIALTIDRPDHVELTCASLINRLPHLIEAPAGYVTTDRFPPPRYAAFDSQSGSEVRASATPAGR
jgi:4-hydroxy-tetrahydrodipicolinate reductase